MKKIEKNIKKYFYLSVGFLSLGMGVVGIIVPLLPTTPLLLLAVWCFGKSSPRMQRKIFQIPVLGKYIKDYRDGNGIPLKVKVFVISLLWLSMLAVIVFVVDWWWLRSLLVLIAVFVTYHIITIKPKTRNK